LALCLPQHNKLFPFLSFAVSTWTINRPHQSSKSKARRQRRRRGEHSGDGGGDRARAADDDDLDAADDIDNEDDDHDDDEDEDDGEELLRSYQAHALVHDLTMVHGLMTAEAQVKEKTLILTRDTKT
jgi:hypothetical protein